MQNRSSKYDLGLKTNPTNIMEELLERNKNRKFDFITLGLFFLCLMLLLWLVVISVFPLCEISGTSMQPQIGDGDKALILERDDYARGEVVVFYSQSEKKVLIKRVIAISGDKVMFLIDQKNQDEPALSTVKLLIARQGGEYEQLDEDDYILEPMLAGHNFSRLVRIGDEVEVGEGQFFVLGDNRNVSLDSRIIGVISLDDIYGKTIIVAAADSFLAKLFSVMYISYKTTQNN